MKVKGLTSCAGENFSISTDKEADLPDKIAKELVKAGHAEPVKKAKMPKTTASKKAKGRKKAVTPRE